VIGNLDCTVNNSGQARFKMVIFTSILIVVILYFLQSDGFIYVTVIALVAELINIFMTHTVTKAVEKKLTIQHRRILDGYKNRLKSKTKTIKEFEQLQEDAVKKLYNANMKIKEYEQMLAGDKTAAETTKTHQPKPNMEEAPLKTPPEQKMPKKEYIDLPDGSDRNKATD
jgi:hypothetical protein